MSQLLPYIYGIHTATIVYIVGNYYGHLYKVGDYTFSYIHMLHIICNICDMICRYSR